MARVAPEHETSITHCHLNKYKSDFEEFGMVDFKNATLQTNGGLQETTLS